MAVFALDRPDQGTVRSSPEDRTWFTSEHFFRAVEVRGVGRTRTDWLGAELEPLAALYMFEDYDEVRRFLTATPDAIAVLFDAFPHIASVFGTATPVTLRVQPDHDEGGADELLVLIRDEGDIDSALERLGKLDEQWWRDVSGRIPALVVDVG